MATKKRPSESKSSSPTEPPMTKLEWAAVQLAAAMIASGDPPEHLEAVAVRGAKRILQLAQTSAVD